jgi:phytoene/squalene synthetase
VYQGIHDEIRRNGYDNVRRRAVTTTGRKVALAVGALWGVARPPALHAAL